MVNADHYSWLGQLGFREGGGLFGWFLIAMLE